MAVWNDAEAPEPPANLTATLKGAVIHRFCETYREDDDVEARLTTSFEDVLSQRQAELAGRAFDINKGEAVRALTPLAKNYLASDVFRRVSRAAPASAGELASEDHRLKSVPQAAGLWSELRFRLRRPLGILTGTIDKLLITPAKDGKGVDVEIIDFKTNRFSPARNQKQVRTAAATQSAKPKIQASNPTPTSGQGLLNFDFVSEESIAVETPSPPTSINDQIEIAAHDYQMQMQAYAMAVRELLPAEVRIQSLRATLHFIDPNVEIDLDKQYLDRQTCAQAIDSAMNEMASLDGTLDAESFPPFPASHCRICNFLDLCPAGREWLRGQ